MNAVRTVVVALALIVLASGVAVGVRVLQRQSEQLAAQQALTRSNSELIRAVEDARTAELEALQRATTRQLRLLRRHLRHLRMETDRDHRKLLEQMTKLLNRNFELQRNTFITEVQRTVERVTQVINPPPPPPPPCHPPPKC